MHRRVAQNIDMTRNMSQEELAAVIKEKSRRNDSTIDNNATTSQMTYLARLYRETKETRYRDAFRAGVEYLLSGQYENGGWPQFWPEKRGYQYHITFNDDAMVNTLELLRSIMTEQQPYDKGLTDKSLQNYVKKLETRFGDHFTTLYDTIDKS